MKNEQGYGALFAVPGFARLALTTILGRIAGQSLGVVIVLFVLQRFHSPVLAGVAAFVSIFPGILVSPLAGALLDRHGRTRLVILDYALGGAIFLVIGGLAVGRLLSPALLLVLLGLAAISSPLSNTGLRSLFPLVVPRPLWERANAVDSNGYVIGTLFSAVLGGGLVAVVGGPLAIVVNAMVFLVAAWLARRLDDPPVVAGPQLSLLRETWSGITHVLEHPTLRGLAVVLFLLNVAGGIFTIAMPVAVLTHLHLGAAFVGTIYATQAVAGFVAVTAAGLLNTAGREREIMAGATLISLAGLLVLMFAPGPLVFLVGAALLGAANGPYDIALFTLRQRRTDPAWLGRAFAISMALNYSGMPLGAAAAGPLVSIGLTAAWTVALTATVISGLLPLLIIPSDKSRAHPGLSE